MASLINTKIKDTYEGLIKTLDNLALSGTAKAITDGAGNPTNITMSTTSTNFPSGTVDFTGATVSGLPDLDTTYTIGSVQDGLNADIKLTDQLGNDSKVTLVAGTNITLSNLGNDLTINGGAAGLVNGAAADSMISDASLTTTPASALALRGIALGDNARAAVYANQLDSIAIGTNALSEGSSSISIGKDAYGQSGDEIAIGTSSHARLGDGIAIGRSAYAGNTGNIALGKLANCDYQYTGAMALGTDTVVAANGGVALGASVTADKIDTVSMKALDLQTASTPTAGGIIMTDAGSTERRLNITAGGALQIDSTPVGGGSAGMTVGSGSNSVQSAVTGATGNASSSNSIAIGNGATATGGTGAMAYGQDAVANGTHAAAFGQYSEATNSYAISFGRTSVASGDGSVAFGQQTSAAQAGAVAMGRQVTSDTADTTHVRALKIVAPNGGTGGNGITMLSPDGTAYTLTVSNAGALVIS